MITTEAVTDKDIVDNIIAARKNETEEDEDKEVKETTEPPKKKPTQQTVDAAFEVIHDWIEMTEDKKIYFFQLSKDTSTSEFGTCPCICFTTEYHHRAPQ